MIDKPNLAATPPMGWNSWNTFGNKVNEEVIRETADALVASGLRDLGYRYIVIDDCWSLKGKRDGNGDLIADPAKFPSGIAALADYVHNLGFKLGIYSDAAERTCAGFPGSYGFEDQDAALWASWKIDYLKYDYCHAPKDQASAIERYSRMGQALRKSGRDILYSVCEWGARSPHLWASQLGAHMWRISGDVYDSWVSVRVELPNEPPFYSLGIDSLFDKAAIAQPYAGPNGWNDLDMLVVGLKGKGQIKGSGMSFVEYQTQMSLWSIVCSPLMIGCDLRSLDAESGALLSNREVLAVNQDPLGIAGRRVRSENGCEIWVKPLSDGSVAAAIVNRGSVWNDFTLKASDVGLLDSPKLVRDLWAQSDLAEFRETLEFRVEAHQTRFFRIQPA